MQDLEVLEELEKRGLVYEDKHFVYSKGRHGSAYVDLRPAYPDIGFTYWLGHDIAVGFQEVDQEVDFDLVIGPDFGGNELAEVVGAVVASWDEYHNRKIRIVRTRKRGKGFMVHPGRHYEQHLKGCRALVLDDTLLTGGAVKSVMRLVRRHGGTVVAVGGVVDRGGLTAETFGVEQYMTLVKVPFKSYPVSECPLCARRRPIVLDLGYGERFQSAHPNYPGGFTNLLAA